MPVEGVLVMMGPLGFLAVVVAPLPPLAGMDVVVESSLSMMGVAWGTLPCPIIALPLLVVVVGATTAALSTGLPWRWPPPLWG